MSLELLDDSDGLDNVVSNTGCRSVVPEGGEGTPPYGQYPTDTRFRRPDYKFYKTLDDSAEFLQRVSSALPPPPLPPPGRSKTPPPTQQQQQQQPQQPLAHRPSPRRPVTAYARWPPRQQQQLLQQQPPREPEPGWRPIYPTPDLSTPRLHSRPLTAPSTRSSQQKPVDDEADQTDEAEAGKTTSNKAVASAHHRTTPTPLAVVDFLETCQPVAAASAAAALKPAQLLPQPSNPPPSAAGFYRPKTAPGRVPNEQRSSSLSAPSNAGLQIQGHRLLPTERATSAKSAGHGGASFGGVRQLSEAYDRALAVHGWRMEVPGDPYGIKHHLIPERKPITVTVPEPTVKPLPPRMRRTNRFTFFHTTAPRVVMSFDIHPNFTSEQYSKFRAGLIKQGKWDYRYRDFSFMY